jgi:hypothetical protein
MIDYQTLKLQSPMMHGPAVVRLQEMLDLLGYGTTEPNDGIYGKYTSMIVTVFQNEHGLIQDGICGPKTWAAIINAVDEQEGKRGRITVAPGITDRRDGHPHPRLYKCKRPWSTITGVTLHQTGCAMPSSPAGWDRLNAHIGVPKKGPAILVNDPTDFIYHGQGLSPMTIGIEFEGNFEGIKGDISTLWKGGGGPDYLTDSQIEQAEKIRLYLIDQFKSNGSEWKYILAHRQSYKSRIGDPGEEIWQNVAIPWSMKMDMSFDFDGGDSFNLGKGRPIPWQWDDNRSSNYH